MTTITASTTIGVNLASPNFVNPVVVNPGVTISTTGDAIIASAGSWTLQNKGRISGAGAFANGIDLSAGAVTNFATGLVTGSSDGVRIYGAGGVVGNYGSIAGQLGASSVYYGFGVDLLNGGAVTNHAGGTISGYASGIDVYGAAGTIINAGMITGHNYNGVILRRGGGYGVLIKGGAGAAVNAGMISGGIGMYAGGAVTNQVGGTIVGSASKAGVYVAGGAATGVNAGSIG